MPRQLYIQQFKPEDWSLAAAKIIHNRIKSVLKIKTECTVMLTGGRSAENIYSTWSDLPEFEQLNGVLFYFTDERCVPPDSPDSNYGMAMRTLFKKRIPLGCSVLRIVADDIDTNLVVNHYSEMLPHSIDVMLLGLGDDGHIASLFPHSAALSEMTRQVLFVTAPKASHNRVTITPAVIKHAKYIYVLASGPSKLKALSLASLDFNDIDSLPARLVCNAVWLTDQELQVKKLK